MPAHLYRFQEDDDIGQSYRTKWGAIGNMLGNILGNWGTCWNASEKLDGNILGTEKKIQHGHFGLYVYYLQIDMQLLILWE